MRERERTHTWLKKRYNSYIKYNLKSYIYIYIYNYNCFFNCIVHIHGLYTSIV